MANYETAAIRPSTSKSFNIIQKALASGKLKHELLIFDDYRFHEIQIKVEKGVTLDFLTQISQFYPNDKVEVDIEYESEDYEKRYKYTIFNCNSELVEIKNTNYRKKSYYKPGSLFELTEEAEEYFNDLAKVVEDAFFGNE